MDDSKSYEFTVDTDEKAELLEACIKSLFDSSIDIDKLIDDHDSDSKDSE